MATNSSGEHSSASTEVRIEMPPLHDGRLSYHRLASAMGLYPDLAIFKRFSTLSVLNILYLQAELVDIQKQLGEAAEADATSSDPLRREYHRAWLNLSHGESMPNGNGRQQKIFLRIREVLQQYRKSGPSYLLPFSIWETHQSRNGNSPSKETWENGQPQSGGSVNPHHVVQKHIHGLCLPAWVGQRFVGIDTTRRATGFGSQRLRLLALCVDDEYCDDLVPLGYWQTLQGKKVHHLPAMTMLM
jgi:hypothetical protein